jgi:hypothetical protein
MALNAPRRDARRAASNVPTKHPKAFTCSYIQRRWSPIQGRPACGEQERVGNSRRVESEGSGVRQGCYNHLIVGSECSDESLFEERYS